MFDMTKVLNELKKYRYPIIILIIGLVIMLLPGEKEKQDYKAADESFILQSVLTDIKGVGRASALISENGVVVVCDGAYDAGVKLDIISAVHSYTGFGSDKITVLKRA